MSGFSTDIGVQLTDQQRRALEPAGTSMVLSAGAGCGKTRVLAERFLLHLAPGRHHLGLGHVAALTFTERAAREMRDRIRQRCRELLLTCPDADVAHWSEVLRDLPSASIDTIHGFCGRMLRAHAVEVGVDPRCEVLDPAAAAALVSEVIRDHLLEQLAVKDQELASLILRYGGLTQVERLLTQWLPECDGTLVARWENASPSDLVDVWLDLWTTRGRPARLRRIAQAPESKSLLALLKTVECSDGRMEGRRRQIVEALEQLALRRNPAPWLAQLARSAYVRGAGGQNAWPDETIYRFVGESLARLREALNKSETLNQGDRDQLVTLAGDGLQFLRLLKGADDAYAQRKSAAALLDFRDLLVKSRDLLQRHDAVRAHAARHWKLLLVDEFQDTDPVQVEILRGLCGEGFATGKLFVVGDAKQSIYRFRGADWTLFQAVRHELPREGHRSITLNFRSRPAILEFVNFLFRERWGEEYEALTSPEAADESPQHVEFLWTLKRPDEAVDESRRREAHHLAARIHEMLAAGHPTIGQGPAARPARAGDVVVLFRALSDVHHYEHALRERGLESYVVGGGGFYAQQEVYDIVNLLRAIENPDDDLSVAGVLRSPFFSLRDETLYWLSAGRGELSAGLDQPSRWENVDASERDRVGYARDTLATLCRLKDDLTITALLRSALDLTGYDAALLFEPLGPRKLANLHKLIEVARAFDAAATFTLSDFADYLSDVVTRQPVEEQAATQGEAGDVIRLMTIHQAKGLEFPIVFVADVDRPGVARDATGVVHRTLGPLVGARGQVHTGLETYRAMEDEEEGEENLRLLYVACTRASDYLVLSSAVKLAEFEREGRRPISPKSDWMSLLAERFDLRVGRAAGPGAPLCVVVREGATEAPIPASSNAVPAEKVEPAVLRLRPCDSPPLWKPVASPRRRRAFRASELHTPAPEEAWNDLPLFRGRDAHSQGRMKHDDDARLEPNVADDLGPRALGGANAKSEDVLPLGETPATLFGSVVHALLERIDFRSPDEQAVNRWLAYHERQLGGAWKAVEAAEVRRLVTAFLHGPVARELAEATECHRELEYLLAWPPDAAETPSQYFQGFIDCVYRDRAGAWHLLDYKTDVVDADDVAAKGREYELQLGVYALAARDLCGGLQSARLCFLQPGITWSLDLSPGWEPRMVYKVEQAIGRHEEARTTAGSTS